MIGGGGGQRGDRTKDSLLYSRPVKKRPGRKKRDRGRTNVLVLSATSHPNKVRARKENRGGIGTTEGGNRKKGTQMKGGEEYKEKKKVRSAKKNKGGGEERDKSFSCSKRGGEREKMEHRGGGAIGKKKNKGTKKHFEKEQNMEGGRRETNHWK